LKCTDCKFIGVSDVKCQSDPSKHFISAVLNWKKEKHVLYVFPGPDLNLQRIVRTKLYSVDLILRFSTNFFLAAKELTVVCMTGWFGS
jgi:hypothetical protein